MKVVIFYFKSGAEVTAEEGDAFLTRIRRGSVTEPFQLFTDYHTKELLTVNMQAVDFYRFQEVANG